MLLKMTTHLFIKGHLSHEGGVVRCISQLAGSDYLISIALVVGGTHLVTGGVLRSRYDCRLLAEVRRRCHSRTSSSCCNGSSRQTEVSRRGHGHPVVTSLSDVLVEVVETFRLVTGRRAGLESAGEGLLVEEGLVGADEAVLHHGQLSVTQEDRVANMEDLAVVGDIGVGAQSAVGAAEGHVDTFFYDLIGTRGQAEIRRLGGFGRCAVWCFTRLGGEIAGNSTGSSKLFTKGRVINSNSGHLALRA